jgi:hypothetical protein
LAAFSAGERPAYTQQNQAEASEGIEAVSSSIPLSQPDLPTGRIAPAQVTSRSAPGTTEEASEKATDLDFIEGLAVAVQPMPMAGPELPAALPAIALAQRPVSPVLAHQPRLYVGVVGAPDVSTVKFAGIHAPLLNVGVNLEYRLTNRLRLTTGLLRSTKHYVANREDYDWSKYPRAQARYFKQVDGACTVLDVPLNLRYDFMARPQDRIFGSTGLSTFFMQHERYSYHYLENNIPMLWERRLVNENEHLFSILNLSVGYEHSFGPRWSAQAEPYVKVPLAGVGAGKVQLTSGGVFFGVKYGF